MTSSETIRDELLHFIISGNYVLRICKAKGLREAEFKEIQQATAVRINDLSNSRQLVVSNVNGFVSAVAQRVIYEFQRQQRKFAATTLDEDVASALSYSAVDDRDDELREFVWSKLSDKDQALADLLSKSSSIHEVAKALSISVTNAHQCKSRLYKTVKRILASAEND